MPEKKPSAASRQALLLLLGLLLACGACEKKPAPPARQASPARRATTRPKPPKEPQKPPCQEGSRLPIHCLPFCGTNRVVGFAFCIKGKPTCKSGVREDRCHD